MQRPSADGSPGRADKQGQLVDCERCGFGNPEGMAFCGGCGEALSRNCTACGYENLPHFRFCGRCGVPCAASATVPQVRGERRQLTVMFCDLVGSTSLSERVDPEVLHELIVAYQGVVAERVEHYGGTIAQYLGDGVLVYFGLPNAHEDDAHRAISAALSVLEAMATLNQRLLREYGVELALRTGIHTGPVVVGEIGAGAKLERAAVGETMNVAARFSSSAPVNSIVIGGATLRLVSGYFELESLGELPVKGLSHPLAAYRVLRATGASGRLDVAALSGLSPFVGRERELSLLLERWQRAQTGEAQVVTLGGEPGIGKSRLIRTLRERVAEEQPLWFEGRCTALSQNSSLYPIITLLHEWLGLARDGDGSARLQKLEKSAAHYGLDADAVPLLASLLSVPTDGKHELPVMTPQRQRQRTLEALVAWLIAIARTQPLVLVIEDLHWVDPSTLELLNMLVASEGAAQLLLLVATRPEITPPWGLDARRAHLALNRLPGAEVERLVRSVAGAEQLPPEVVARVVAKVDGVPLFAEEMTKTVIESRIEQGGGDELQLPRRTLDIPSTLNDSLMARLDRLGRAKEVAQFAATLGRRFSYALLHDVAEIEDQRLRRDLDRLVRAGLLNQLDGSPELSYQFNHALVQDTAYQSLLHSERRKVHLRAARALEARFQDTAAAQPELLAYHFTEARCTLDAVRCWLVAGQLGFARSANQEAVAHLSRGLELIEAVEPLQARVPLEIALQTSLGGVLATTHGYAAPGVEHAFARARLLAGQVGDVPEIFPILRGLAQFHEVRAQYDVALGMTQQMERLAQQTGHVGFDLEATGLKGQALFWTGEIEQAHALEQRAIALYKPLEHRSHAQLFGEDPGVRAQLYFAWIEWMRGYPDRAARHSAEARRLAEEAPHPFTLCLAYNFTAALHQLRREPAAVAERAAAAIVVATEQHFPFWAAMGSMYQGWARAVTGQYAAGVQELEGAIAMWQAIGCRLGCPSIFGMLADAHRANGQPEPGLVAVSSGLEIMEQTNERFYEGELLRLRAELHALQGKEPAALRSDLARSIELSRARGQRSLELRARMSACRLDPAAPEAQAQRAALRALYDGIQEGRDSADLVDAAQLLAH